MVKREYIFDEMVARVAVRTKMTRVELKRKVTKFNKTNLTKQFRRQASHR